MRRMVIGAAFLVVFTGCEDSRPGTPAPDVTAEVDVAPDGEGETVEDAVPDSEPDADAETETVADADAEPETVADAETETVADAEPETDADAGTETETVADADAETEAETDADADTETETVTDADAETETVAEADAEPETVADADAEPETVADADALTDADAEPETVADAGPDVDPDAPPPPCIDIAVPSELVAYYADVDLYYTFDVAPSFGDPGLDFLVLEFYSDATGPFDLDVAPNDDYATCEQCVLAFDGDPFSGAVVKTFYQAEGTIDIDGMTPPYDGLVAATLTGVKLVEVTIDEDTYTSTPVPGGACLNIADVQLTTEPNNSCQSWCGQTAEVPGSQPTCFCDAQCANIGDCCDDICDPGVCSDDPAICP